MYWTIWTFCDSRWTFFWNVLDDLDILRVKMLIFLECIGRFGHFEGSGKPNFRFASTKRKFGGSSWGTPYRGPKVAGFFRKWTLLSTARRSAIFPEICHRGPGAEKGAPRSTVFIGESLKSGWQKQQKVSTQIGSFHRGIAQKQMAKTAKSEHPDRQFS